MLIADYFGPIPGEDIEESIEYLKDKMIAG